MKFLHSLFPHAVGVRLMELEQCGIAVRPDAHLRLFAEELADVEADDFEQILAVMGRYLSDPEAGLESRPVSDDIFEFDFETVDNPGVYRMIVEDCARISKGDFSPDHVSDDIDFDAKTARVDITWRGEKRTYDLAFDNDWADPAIFDIVAKYLVGSEKKKRLAMHEGGLIVCKPDVELQKLNTTTSMNFRPIGER